MRRRSTFLFATMLGCGIASIAVWSCSSQQFIGGDTGADAASNDGAIGDGSVSDVQASDASSDAAAGPFCTSIAPPPFFCADFDEADFRDAYKNGAPIALQDVTDGGSVSAPGGGESLPNALFSSVPSAAVSEAVTSAIFGATGKTHYRLELDFEFDALPPAPPVGGLNLFALQMTNGASSAFIKFGVAMVSNGIAVHIDENGGNTYTKIGDAPPKGKWVHATIDVSLDSKIVIFIIEGITPQKMGIDTGAAYDTPTLSLGLVSPGGIPATSAHYDNVTLAVDDAADGG